jgi:hypothetical protein
MKNQTNLWLEILGAGTAGALGVAVFLATLGAAAGVASGENAAPQAATPPSMSQPSPALVQTYEGMVTCSRCGAKHAPSISKNASDCVRICVHDGSSFALIDGNDVYLLEGDWEQVKKVAGQRAEITGSLSGHTIEVSSVAAQ